MSLRRLESIPSFIGKVTRRLGGLRHRMSKTKFRMSSTIMALAVVLFAVFISSGGVYDIFDNPPTILSGPRGYIAVRGLNDEQTLLESILSMLFATLTFAGLLVSSKSTEVIYNSRRATTRLVFGILLLIVGLTGSYYLLNLKDIVLRSIGY